MIVLSGYGRIEEMTTGDILQSKLVLFQLNVGLKVASHGYPNRRSSFPMSAMRKFLGVAFSVSFQIEEVGDTP